MFPSFFHFLRSNTVRCSGFFGKRYLLRVRIVVMLKAFLPFFITLFIISGCVKKTVEYGGEQPDVIYSRIISLSPSTTELLAMLRQESFMVGRTASCDMPETIRSIPIVANPRPDFELIVGLKPDLIFIDESVANSDDLEKMKQLGLSVKVLKIKSVDDWIKTVYELGNLLLQHQPASREVDKVREAVSVAQAENISPKPRVMVAMGESQSWVAGTKTFQADVMRAAGGEYIGPDDEKFVPVNPEQIIAWNPDIVFVSDNPDAYKNIAGWKDTNAVKTGNIFRIHPNLLLRPGARLSVMISSIRAEFVKYSKQQRGIE